MAQANMELKAGIEVRMLAPPPTDASKGLGMFDALNGSEDAAALARRFSHNPRKKMYLFSYTIRNTSSP